MATAKKIGGEWWFVNPHKTRKNKKHKKNKGGIHVAKRKRARKHTYRIVNKPKVRYRTRTVTKIRYRNKPKRRVNRRRKSSSIPRLSFMRRSNPPLFLGRHFTKRHRRHRNPKLLGGFKKMNFKVIAAIAVGLMAPSVGRQLFPYFKFSSKIANFALGVAYAGTAMLVSKWVFKTTPAFQKTVLYAGFAGAAVSIWGELVTSNQLLSSLSPSKLLPSASPAATGYYFQNQLSAAQLNDEILTQTDLDEMSIY